MSSWTPTLPRWAAGLVPSSPREFSIAQKVLPRVREGTGLGLGLVGPKLRFTPRPKGHSSLPGPGREQFPNKSRVGGRWGAPGGGRPPPGPRCPPRRGPGAPHAAFTGRAGHRGGRARPGRRAPYVSLGGGAAGCGRGHSVPAAGLILSQRPPPQPLRHRKSKDSGHGAGHPFDGREHAGNPTPKWNPSPAPSFVGGSSTRIWPGKCDF